MKKNATDSSRQTLRDIQIVTLEPAHGRDWTWFADLGIVTISPRLDTAGRERALTELAARLSKAA